MAYQEKPAVRPDGFVESGQWQDLDFLKKKHEELKAKIRRRTGDAWEDERHIYANTQIAKRIRELEPPIVIPKDSTDPTNRFHSLPVHERALRMARHRVHDAAHTAGSKSTTILDIATERVGKHLRMIRQHPDFPERQD